MSGCIYDNYDCDNVYTVYTEKQVSVHTNNNGINGVNLPKSLPQSKIVSLDTDFKKKAYDIYCKYICIGSEYEINIDGLLRKQFSDIMGNKLNDEHNFQQFCSFNVTVKDMLDLYEQCCKEMYQLLMFSFSRFKTNRVYYDKCVQVLDK